MPVNPPSAQTHELGCNEFEHHHALTMSICYDGYVQVPAGAPENGSPESAAPGAEAEVDMSMFDLSKKKKKKKKKVKPEGEDEDGAGDGDDREEGEGMYRYETLLERIQVDS